MAKRYWLMKTEPDTRRGDRLQPAAARRVLPTMKRLALAALLVVSSLTSALAQPADRVPEHLAAQDCSRARALEKPCVLTMDAEEVGGGTARQDGSQVVVRTPARFGTLIRYRADFRAELIRAAEDL